MALVPATNQSLASSEDYFLSVLKPNYDAFFGTSSTFASALNLAITLYHFHEWLFEEFKSQLETEFNRQFSAAGSFWKAVEQRDPKFGYIRDVTNASKHVRIGTPGHPSTSTTMTHIANTHIVSSGWGVGGYGQGRFGGGPNVVFDEGGTLTSFDDCATALFTYWKSLLQQMTGQTYP